MGRSGKSLEDEFIYKRDRELIEARLEREKKLKRNQDLESHKHHCAHCGDSMHDMEFESATISACSNCGSVHMTLEALDKVSSEQDIRRLYYKVREEKEKEETKVA